MQRVRDASRRSFLRTSSLAVGSALAPAGIAGLAAPALVRAQDARPAIEQGLSFGDPTHGRTLVWSRTDRPARLLVDVAFNEMFADAQRIIGPHALETTDFTVRQDLLGLPSDRDVWVRATFEDLSNARVHSEALVGHFRTPGKRRRDVRFLWGGDTAGQGWGINPDFGGMRI